jgi:hypothetical protein
MRRRSRWTCTDSTRPKQDESCRVASALPHGALLRSAWMVIHAKESPLPLDDKYRCARDCARAERQSLSCCGKDRVGNTAGSMAPASIRATPVIHVSYADVPGPETRHSCELPSRRTLSPALHHQGRSTMISRQWRILSCRSDCLWRWPWACANERSFQRARHCLHHHEAEPFRPVDGKEKGCGLAEERHYRRPCPVVLRPRSRAFLTSVASSRHVSSCV